MSGERNSRTISQVSCNNNIKESVCLSGARRVRSRGGWVSFCPSTQSPHAGTASIDNHRPPPQADHITVFQACRQWPHTCKATRKIWSPRVRHPQVSLPHRRVVRAILIHITGPEMNYNAYRASQRPNKLPSASSLRNTRSGLDPQTSRRNLTDTFSAIPQVLPTST
jgi:hypothetical protein